LTSSGNINASLISQYSVIETTNLDNNTVNAQSGGHDFGSGESAGIANPRFLCYFAGLQNRGAKT